jgi:hypothetical protein
MRQNCNQNQLKGLNIQSDISVNMDVFNRRLLTQIPKVALDYDVDWSRYYRTKKFYCDVGCVETYSHSAKIHISFMLDRNLQTVSFSMLGHFTVRVIACLGVIL